MDSIGTRRPVIPLLVHEDCMDSIKTDLAEQQASLSNIETDTYSIRTSSSNTATQLGTIKADTDALKESVGITADGSSSNSVIGLLKSISNKLTSF